MAIERVLVIDDSPTDQHLISSYLKNNGFEVCLVAVFWLFMLFLDARNSTQSGHLRYGVRKVPLPHLPNCGELVSLAGILC